MFIEKMILFLTISRATLAILQERTLSIGPLFSGSLCSTGLLMITMVLTGLITVEQALISEEQDLVSCLAF